MYIAHECASVYIAKLDRIHAGIGVYVSTYRVT